MEARRCNIHGLVAASDGRCVICRRGDDALPKASQALISPTTWLIVGCGVVTGSLMIWGLNRIQAGFDSKKNNRTEPAIVAVAEENEPPPAPAATGWRKRPTPAPEVTESASAAPVDDEAALEAAKKSLKITLYGNVANPNCAQARAYLSEKGYRFADLDVETSPTNKVLLQAINPRGSVPTIDIDGEVMVGWGAARFDELATKRARARMR